MIGKKIEWLAKFPGENAIQLQCFGQPGGQERGFHPGGNGKNALDNEAAQSRLIRRARMMLLDEIARLLEEISVLNAGRARDLAGAAAEAKIYVADTRTIEGESSRLQCAHDINAAARRFVFVSGLEVGGAGAKAQTAVNAGERLSFIQKFRNCGHA